MERWKERPNERNAREAFIRILKRITGRQYEVERWPERENRKSQDVEYILISKDGRSHRIAVEHTVVESFEGQKGYLSRSYDVVEEVNDQCKGRLPADRYYYLVVPPRLIVSLTGERRRQFVSDVAPWVANIARTLAADQWSSPHDDYKLTLWCPGPYPGMNGNVFRCPTPPEEAEELQRKRFRRAVREKERKLHKYKLNGFSTALLLEDLGGSLRDHRARWRDLTRTQKHRIREFVDYVVILLSSRDQRMIAGEVWKEEARRAYSEIPQDRKFKFC